MLRLGLFVALKDGLVDGSQADRGGNSFNFKGPLIPPRQVPAVCHDAGSRAALLGPRQPFRDPSDLFQGLGTLAVAVEGTFEPSISVVLSHRHTITAQSPQ
jgi:hypothetical protein